MSKNIKVLLHDFEREKEITILFAGEIGSHAYNASHRDSDHDIGIIFSYPMEKYLHINRPVDAFHYKLEDKVEIHGWDIYKMTKLLLKSNPSLYEWLRSNQIYMEDKVFITKLRESFLPRFSLLKMAHHYYQMALRNVKKYESNNKDDDKLLFQIVRSYLMYRWITTKKTHPPILFKELIQQKLPTFELHAFTEIYKCKTKQSYGQLHILEVIRTIQVKLNELETTISSLPNDKIAINEVNPFILHYWNLKN